jgi:uncharacterized protein RhaS with RHS repeats
VRYSEAYSISDTEPHGYANIRADYYPDVGSYSQPNDTSFSDPNFYTYARA